MMFRNEYPNESYLGETISCFHTHKCLLRDTEITGFFSEITDYLLSKRSYVFNLRLIFLFHLYSFVKQLSICSPGLK